MVARLIVVTVILVFVMGSFQSSNGQARPKATPSEDTYVRMTDLPGFGANGTVVVTTVNNRGVITIETKKYGDTQRGALNAATVTRTVPAARAKELFQLIDSTKFFAIREEATEACSTDGPTVSLEVKTSSRHKTVRGIGGDCAPAELADAKKIVQAVRQLVSTPQ